MQIILRHLCIQSSQQKKLTVIDPQRIFLRELSLVSNISFICLDIHQLSHVNIQKVTEGVDVVIIKVPPAEWTLQFIRSEAMEEYAIDSNNYKIKWNKTEIRLNKNQKFIFLKEEFSYANELTEKRHFLVYYDM